MDILFNNDLKLINQILKRELFVIMSTQYKKPATNALRFTY